MPPSRTKPTLWGKKSAVPGFIDPALATLRAAPPTGAGWMHELKFDGYRLQAQIRRRGVKLLTRSGLDWTAKFGAALAAAFADMPVDEAIVDGELVAENASGSPDFSLLQDAIVTGRTDRLVFYAFDLLSAPGIIRYSEDFPVEGARLLRHVCRLGLEGVVSKRSKCAIPLRPGEGLDQGQVLAAAGIRGGRLCAVHGLAQDDRGAGTGGIVPAGLAIPKGLTLFEAG